MNSISSMQSLRSFVPRSMPATLHEGASVGDTLESVAVCGTVTGAPSLLGAAFGFGGFAVGMGAVTAMNLIGVKDSESRRILLPLSLLVGGLAGAAGMAFGWPGAVVATGLGAAYGWKCA